MKLLFFFFFFFFKYFYLYSFVFLYVGFIHTSRGWEEEVKNRDLILLEMERGREEGRNAVQCIALHCNALNYLFTYRE